MVDHLTAETSALIDADDQDGLRIRNRSPHPYNRQSGELQHASYNVPKRDPFSKESTPISDSGTEADDEHILKGLPAPKTKLHKGLRGQNEALSGTSTPLRTTSTAQYGLELIPSKLNSQYSHQKETGFSGLSRDGRNIVRRISELGILFLLGILVVTNHRVLLLASSWKSDFVKLGAVLAFLIALYPLRLTRWAYWHRRPATWLPVKIPPNFDPAPLLYPPSITLFVSFLVSTSNPAFLPPNIILALSSLPQQLIPKFELGAQYDGLHWIITCSPLITRPHELLTNDLNAISLPVETITVIYPLHRCTCALLRYLTTTSLLTAELQLLSIALINILVLATSPQMQILKALLWGGGVGLLILCGPVIRWGVSLARIPKWRFRKLAATDMRPFWSSMMRALSWRRISLELRRSQADEAADDNANSTGEESESEILKTPPRTRTLGPSSNMSPETQASSSPQAANDEISELSRRHTLPVVENTSKLRPSYTASGRKKRSTSASVRPFLRLTYEQAIITKWTYAAYVYACILLIILGGIRSYIQHYALSGAEPIGWALGYLFGDWPWLRFQIVNANLERWIRLPLYHDVESLKACHMGWVEHVRQSDFGEANTRLLISAYWLCIVVFGLLVVFQLKSTYEVDTRRKVFHFMMVGMFVPVTYVDPTYAALALGFVLAIFLILDLLRASQLPPLSKPLAAFLAPYVDGRDFRGPVVISHIFLLIGCAIPLWLALGSLPRTDDNALPGWEIPTREVSMVSGVICVGLGDAAASLIGRRWGRHKWIWGGGKSLEGSVAFACAVFVGLFMASAWLRIGRWPVTDEPSGVVLQAGKAAMCGSIASFTEAVLTGGNDNVIVPVVLWTCVKSLGI